MGKQKKTRKFAVAKKVMSANDNRIKANQEKVLLMYFYLIIVNF